MQISIYSASLYRVEFGLCYNTFSFAYNLAPSAFHALLERQMENLVHASACFGGTFDVSRANVFGDGAALLWGYGRLALGAEHAYCLLIAAEICLCRDENERSALAKVGDFWIPLQTVRWDYRGRVYNVLCPVRSPDLSENRWRRR